MTVTVGNDHAPGASGIRGDLVSWQINSGSHSPFVHSVCQEMICDFQLRAAGHLVLCEGILDSTCMSADAESDDSLTGILLWGWQRLGKCSLYVRSADLQRSGKSFRGTEWTHMPLTLPHNRMYGIAL